MSKRLKLWLLNTDIGVLNKKYIYIKYNSFEELYSEVFNNNSLISEDLKKKLRCSYIKMEEENTFNYIKENNIGAITFDEEDYPRILRNFSDCPFGLFYRGDITLLNKKRNLSVVGSRRCTRYGVDVTEHIIRELKSYDVNIVSGMAKGIDGVAHNGALKNELKTIAILGSGVDVIYPKENTSLYYKIIEDGGCVISEFPLGTGPMSYNFPIRNRIISGVGDLLLVIEGGEKSGTLITVGTALKQGKEVIAVPGSIFSLESKGTNKLIYDGATPYTNIRDILDLLNISSKAINNIEVQGKASVTNELMAIIDDNPIHIDTLIKLTHIDINELYKLLFELQVKKEILCLSGNFYVRINDKRKSI